MRCYCDSNFRFTYETLDLLELSDRDFSLASSASIVGALHAYDKVSRDMASLKAELLETTRDNTFLEHIVAQLRGATSRGWKTSESDK